MKIKDKIVTNLYNVLKKKAEQINWEERLPIGSREHILDSDRGQLIPIFNFLDEYGLQYDLSWGPGGDLRIGKEPLSPYLISVWGLDDKKAVKSDAYWNVIADENGLAEEKQYPNGKLELRAGLATMSSAIGASRIIDRLATAFGHGEVEIVRENAPIFKGKRYHTEWRFEFTNRARRPKMVIKNTIF
jgi:hypothetical protein